MYDGPGCENPDCTDLAFSDEQKVKCIICKQPCFCSTNCLFDGLHAHLEECSAYEDVKRIIAKRDAETPRSVLNRVFVLVEREPKLKIGLFQMFKSHESSTQTVGALVIRTTTPEDLCTLINSAKDTVSLLLKMTEYEPCINLLRDDHMEPVTQLRLAMMNKNQFVLGVQAKGDIALCRLFNIESRRNTWTSLSQNVKHSKE